MSGFLHFYLKKMALYHFANTFLDALEVWKYKIYTT